MSAKTGRFKIISLFSFWPFAWISSRSHPHSGVCFLVRRRCRLPNVGRSHAGKKRTCETSFEPALFCPFLFCSRASPATMQSSDLKKRNQSVQVCRATLGEMRKIAFSLFSFLPFARFIPPTQLSALQTQGGLQMLIMALRTLAPRIHRSVALDLSNDSVALLSLSKLSEAQEQLHRWLLKLALPSRLP